jgi:hypothetical protein
VDGLFILHPPYTSDLAFSDFLLVAALKNAIRGKMFGNYDKVMEK